jgi:two-component system, OmpR family, sensor histidine kinase SenX3
MKNVFLGPFSLFAFPPFPSPSSPFSRFPRYNASMPVSARRKSVIFFITLGACLVTLAVALYVGWILVNWRQVALLTLGITFFSLIIVGVVLNTIFLVREIRRNEQHDAFINAVTHELKTPIASIRLYLQTLKARKVDETQREQFYDIMLADSERLLLTVEQVLRAGRASHRRRSLNPTVIDLSEMVRECLDLTRVRHNLAADALNFADTLNGEAVHVSGDVDDLRAAVSNLLDNAIKYSDQEVKVSVEVSKVDEKNVAVRIADRGIGIPRAQLKRIFKRFYRAPGLVMARVKGTGLGLFIVHSIVARHGGRVFAESAGVGQGSTFTIQLPRV